MGLLSGGLDTTVLPDPFGSCLVIRTFYLMCLLAVLVILTFGPAPSATATVPLIFDTDMGNDVDDALALGMIHALQRRGECRLIAVTLSKDNRYAAPFVDVVKRNNALRPAHVGPYQHAVCDPARQRFFRPVAAGPRGGGG
jgi:hypothetical protein